MKSTFKTLTTTTDRAIKVRENNKARTFTIVTESGRYRTLPMSKEEFRSCIDQTGNDWQNFLNVSADYYKI